MSRSPERNQNVEGGFRPVRNVGGGVPDLTLQAIMREMERLFDRKLEPIEDRLYRVERREQREMTPEDARQEREHPIQDPYEASGQESDHSSAQSVRRRGR